MRAEDLEWIVGQDYRRVPKRHADDMPFWPIWGQDGGKQRATKLLALVTGVGVNPFLSRVPRAQVPVILRLGYG
jgi:hypothetical protein